MHEYPDDYGHEYEVDYEISCQVITRICELYESMCTLCFDCTVTCVHGQCGIWQYECAAACMPIAMESVSGLSARCPHALQHAHRQGPP